MKHFLSLFLFVFTCSRAQTWNDAGSFADQVYALGEKAGGNLYAGCLVQVPPQTPSQFFYQYNLGWSPVANSTNYASQAFIKSIREYNGELYIGGSFVTAWASSLAYNLARENSGAWAPVGTGFAPTDFIFALEVYKNKLYVAGSFSNAGGIPTSCIAAWNDTTWSVVGTEGINEGGLVRCMKVYNDELYVAGTFSMAGGVPVNNVARWDGENWYPVSFGFQGPNPFVLSMEVYKGELYAAGSFTKAGVDTISGVAKWNGAKWRNAGAGAFTDNIFDLEVYQGELYAVGQFTGIGSASANNIAKWNGTTWSSLGAGLSNGQNPTFGNTLFARSEGLYVGGVFAKAGTLDALNIARWHVQVVDVEENGMDSEIKIWPNPVGDVLSIQIKNQAKGLLEINDASGRLLLREEFYQTSDVEVSNLDPGIYFIKFLINDSVRQMRFVVAR